MPRQTRTAPGGIVYHALNRGNGRTGLFHKPEDYSAFYGSEEWTVRIAKVFGLERTLHPRGRLRKDAK